MKSKIASHIIVTSCKLAHLWNQNSTINNKDTPNIIFQQLNVFLSFFILLVLVKVAYMWNKSAEKKSTFVIGKKEEVEKKKSSNNSKEKTNKQKIRAHIILVIKQVLD